MAFDLEVSEYTQYIIVGMVIGTIRYSMYTI